MCAQIGELAREIMNSDKKHTANQKIAARLKARGALPVLISNPRTANAKILRSLHDISR